NVGVTFLIADDTKSDITLGANIAANVHDNLFVDNRFWGFDVAQRLSPNARFAPPPALYPESGFGFEGTFAHNRYCGNGFNQASVAFRQVSTTLGGGSKHFRFGRKSTYDIHTEDDLTMADFDFDNPETDPDPHEYDDVDPAQLEDAGATLYNTLKFNDSI